MSIDTHLDDALTRVETERQQVEQKLTAFERFTSTVQGVEPARQPGSQMVADGGSNAMAATQHSPRDRCDRVRGAFAETVYEAANDDLSLAETMSEELCEAVALALARGTTHGFTPTVKRTIITATEQRQAELGALRTALRREAESLQSAGTEVEEMTAWLTDADETPLLELGFEQLRARHEQLSRYRDRCEELTSQRQAVLEKTTSKGAAAGVDHRAVVDYLYQEFPISHPVLSTATSLDEVCADCQATVRDHLTRRV